MNDALKILNFNDLLLLDNILSSPYDLKFHLNRGYRHPIIGYCVRCEAKGCNVCPTNKDFVLTNISHGASAEDVLLATRREDENFSEWHEDGVLFVMEGPSKGYDIYEEFEYNGYKKRPPKDWYWIHKNSQSYYYPEQFKGSTYGPLFNSIIFTFKLKKAYITNLIKCGLNDVNDNYKGFNQYDPRALDTCYESFLSKEIQIVKPKAIFCFGANVYKFLYNKYNNERFPWQVIQLPHPARGRNGFSDELFRHSFFSMILEGLYQSGVITMREAQDKYGEFLKLSKRDND